MKIFHISDLHIGKQLNYYNLKENQADILNQIVTQMEVYRPDVLLIAGDVFDKSVPSGEAYTLFDDFLNRIAGITPVIPVCIIAGNHDSPERLRYAGAFLERHQIHISVMPPQTEDAFLKKVVLQDEFGPVNIYLLPFTKPGYVRQLFSDREIHDYETAIRELLARESIDWSERNILVSHQFYQGQGWTAETSDSEQMPLAVGGLDRIDTSVIENFDYVALGHLHGPQRVKKEYIRYAGSPLKYSVSEERHNKSITVVTLEEKGKSPVIEFIPLKSFRDVRSERGTLRDILARATEENCHDFVSVTITDENEPYRMKEQLREVYDYLLDIRVDNPRTRRKIRAEEIPQENLSPAEAFRLFYAHMCHEDMSLAEEMLFTEVLEALTEDEE